MRVIHLIDSGGLYGAERVLLTLVDEQLKQGDIQPLIVSVGAPGEPEKPLEAAAREAGLPLHVARMKPGLNLKATRALLQTLGVGSEGEPVLLHSHGYKFNIILAFLKVREALAVPVVSTVHGYVRPALFSKMWIYERMDRWALKHLDGIVCVSETQKRHQLPERLQARATVIYNGLPGMGKTPVRLPQGKYTPSQPMKLLAAGRLSPEKGFELLLRALAPLVHKGLPICLTIAGEGALRLRLEHLVDTFGLRNAVTFAGYVRDMEALYASHDVLVMPSLTEGLPMTLLEALRAGLPAICSAVGGIPEVAEQAPIQLFRAGDVRALEKLIEDALHGNLPIRQHTDLSKFSAETMAEGYHQLYTGILQGVAAGVAYE
ncbi:glycosyltransferase [Hahella sp. SMD15-11]|uniref:Glycosyltransferase n=1 Tax=Thermohahella caldifontis TaxID=3142973 RepID=A0AB39UXV0_9GAMM